MSRDRLRELVMVSLCVCGIGAANVGSASAVEKDTALSAALHKALLTPDKFVEIMTPVVDENVTTVDEARMLCAKLKTLPSTKVDADSDSPLMIVATFFQQVDSQEALNELTSHGIPELCRIFQSSSHVAPEELRGDLLFVLKILAMYQTDRGTQIVVSAAKMGFEPDDDFWSVIFGQFDAQHPDAKHVMGEFAVMLPPSAIGEGLLDAANDLALSGVEFHHPFDSAEGFARLTTWLGSKDENDYDIAVSAAASLPFLKRPGFDALFTLALDHPDPEVQIEGGWAAGKKQETRGFEKLMHWCLDARYSKEAINYLEELGRPDAVPEKAKEPAFEAKAEMCQWLSDPEELASVPDTIEQIDSRELFWPPTNDRRTVYLFRYHYDADGPDAPEVNGIGMVGSVTFALFGEDLPTLKPAEVYALHCCWELQLNKDKRAPAERSVEAGLKILEAENPSLSTR